MTPSALLEKDHRWYDFTRWNVVTCDTAAIFVKRLFVLIHVYRDYQKAISCFRALPRGINGESDAESRAQLCVRYSENCESSLTDWHCVWSRRLETGSRGQIDVHSCCQVKLHYDLRSVGLSILLSSTPFVPATNFFLLLSLIIFKQLQI
jgi:hypothetical protein